MKQIISGQLRQYKTIIWTKYVQSCFRLYIKSWILPLLAEWVLRDRLGVRVQIQLHKLLWGEEPGR